MAIALIVAFDAEVTRLIQLYIVGVFVSFNLSQLGMIRHWTRLLKTETDPAVRRRMFRSRAINTFGLAMTARRLRHRAAHQVPRRRLDRDPGDGHLLHADAEHPPALRQRRPGARRSRPTTRCCRPGCTRSCWSPRCTSRRCGRWPTPRRPAPTCSRRCSSTPTPTSTARMLEEWDERRIDVPLKVLYSPYREIIRPIVEYVREHPRRQPARRGRGLHPGVRRRALVGAAAAQPDRAAAQGPAAVHAGRDGDLGALPAALAR